MISIVSTSNVVAADAALTAAKPPQHSWLWIMCLLGADYFSTLAYQPSLTFQVAGYLGPLATVVVVLITLFGALPIYWYVAGRSPHGQGSIALHERLLCGWRGKTLILLLLGFAATDFTMLKTISLADAAVHVIQNQFHPWQEVLDAGTQWSGYINKQLIVTLLLGAIGFIFWFVLRKGFTRNVVRLAVPVVGLYLLLNAVVIGAGVATLIGQPQLFTSWWQQVESGQWRPAEAASPVGWGLIVLMCLWLFPKLALGLSGFEMSLILMPQVRGRPDDNPLRPHGRIRNTRKALVVAAVVMSIFLLGSVLVTTVLIPPAEFASGGAAADRALAYLAHGGRVTTGPDPLLPCCGVAFGTLYDLVTVVLLCLAGTSVMTALAVLLPQFMLRFGMELRWAHRWGVLLGLFALINLLVELYFRASVSDQRGAYATGVLMLMSSAGIATVLHKKWGDATERGRRTWLVPACAATAIFVVAAVVVMVQTPSGLLISAAFIVAILAMSVLSRFVRADELRTVGFEFKDEHSKFLWDSLRLADFPVLVPHRPGLHERPEKEKQIRRDHNLDPDADVVFLEVEVDDPSNFFQSLLVEVVQEDKRFIIKLTRCVSVAQAIAAVALEMSRASKPPGLHFGWSEMDLMAASWSYFAFGEGNVPAKVRALLLRAEPDAERRPRVIVG